MYVYCLGFICDEFKPDKFKCPVVILAIEVASHYHNSDDVIYDDEISALIRLDVSDITDIEGLFEVVGDAMLQSVTIGDCFINEIMGRSLEEITQMIRSKDFLMYSFGNYINHIREYKLETVS